MGVGAIFLSTVPAVLGALITCRLFPLVGCYNSVFAGADCRCYLFVLLCWRGFFIEGNLLSSVRKWYG